MCLILTVAGRAGSGRHRYLISIILIRNSETSKLSNEILLVFIILVRPASTKKGRLNLNKEEGWV